jgi:hypothetical protein
MIFSFEDGKVTVLPEAMNIPEVKSVYKLDKMVGKEHFHQWMTYIFYVYRPGGIYESLFMSVRKRTVSVAQLGKGEEYWQEIEAKLEIQKLIEWYTNNSMSKEEQLLYELDIDIDMYLNYLKKISYTKQQEVKTKGPKGKIITSFITVDNSDEKMKAIKNSRDLVSYRKELKKLVRETGQKKKAGKTFRTRQFET